MNDVIASPPEVDAAIFRLILVIPAEAGIQHVGCTESHHFHLFVSRFLCCPPISLPDFPIFLSPDFPSIWGVLAYRRLRYGYPFRRIKLTRGKYALVDPEDFERLNQYKWFCTYYGYAVRKIPKKLRRGKQTRVLMHRELCPAPEEMVVDHINRNPSDNRKANLRPATKQQNCWNAKFKRRPGSSRYTGIYFDKRKGKWLVHMGIDGRSRSFRYYADEVEAAKAYDRLAKKYRGEFAVLNFPEQ